MFWPLPTSPVTSRTTLPLTCHLSPSAFYLCTTAVISLLPSHQSPQTNPRCLRSPPFLSHSLLRPPSVPSAPTNPLLPLSPGLQLQMVKSDGPSLQHNSPEVVSMELLSPSFPASLICLSLCEFLFFSLLFTHQSPPDPTLGPRVFSLHALL